MALHTLIDNLLSDTLGSLKLFLPELVLCGTILVLLLGRLLGLDRLRVLRPFVIAVAGAGLALYLAVPAANADPVTSHGLFTDLLVYDSFTVFFRCILLLFVVLLCVLTRITGIPDDEDGPDFYSLLLGATLGMCLMVSANHLLMVFLAVEMASVPSYALVGLLKGRRRSSEAALKYAIYGAGAAGVMLYGISLLVGVLGSAHLPTMAAQLAALDIPHALATGAEIDTIRVLALGGLMLTVGLAFKLSAVPFHFWCPDVFEGAAAEVNAFLSVASKAAALALLVRVAVGFGYTDVLPVNQGAEELASAGIFSVADTKKSQDVEKKFPSDASSKEDKAADKDEEAADQRKIEGAAKEIAARSTTGVEALEPVRGFMVKLLAFIAALTCTFGNLAAYGQTNIKRLLAYSTIAHAGYMIMPVCAALAATGIHPELARDAIGAMAFYIALYLFMNLSAFAIVAFLRNATGSEEIKDYAGLIMSCPLIVVSFALVLVSLLGMPPLAGFVGKFAIFKSLVEVGGPIMYTLLVIAGLNTAISLVYYIRVVKVMTIDPEPDSRGPVSMGFFPPAYTLAVTAPVVIFGVWFDGVWEWARSAATQFFS